ncbi:glycoside hydrolase family 5 protein [Candidatus Bathyarchaeota archaeon]|nr:glycoside hydrolase family 5 protein [Candidatus Bathyarchaeota archaeon]
MIRNSRFSIVVLALFIIVIVANPIAGGYSLSQNVTLNASGQIYYPSITSPALKTVLKAVSPTLIADINNNPVLLQGVGSWHAVDDITLGACFRGGWGSYSSTYVDEFFSWIHSQSLNFVRFQINAYWTLHDSGYRSRLSEVLTIAENYNVYVMYDFNALAAGTWHEIGTPYTSGSPMSISDFNSACSTLASLCSSHVNAIIEVWNEPSYGSTTTYDLYFNNLPTTLTAIRNAGFNGIVFLMGSTSLTATRYFGGDYANSNDNLGWAIDHPTLFDSTYGSVAVDSHAYYTYLHGGTPDGYPDTVAGLTTLWMTTCRIAEAQNKGICVAMLENGVDLNAGDITNQNIGFSNGLTVCNNNYISWCGWGVIPGNGFALVSSLNPPTWNTQGLIVKNHATSSP